MPTFSARVHRILIRVYIRFTSNETSINLVSFIILIHFITNKEKRVDKSTQHVHRHSLIISRPMLGADKVCREICCIFALPDQ